MARKPKRRNNDDDEDDEDEGAGLTDPIIIGLLERLPPPGTMWADVDRRTWLQSLEAALKVIYKQPEPPDAQKPATPTASVHPTGTVRPPGQR